MEHLIQIINLGAKNCPVGRNGLMIYVVKFTQTLVTLISPEHTIVSIEISYFHYKLDH